MQLLWRGIARRLRPSKGRATFLSVFGPLSLLVLFANWVVGLIVGFGLLHWALETAPGLSFGTSLYLSGVTFFTLGYGDVTPTTSAGRVLAVRRFAGALQQAGEIGLPAHQPPLPHDVARFVAADGLAAHETLVGDEADEVPGL